MSVLMEQSPLQRLAKPHNCPIQAVKVVCSNQDQQGIKCEAGNVFQSRVCQVLLSPGDDYLEEQPPADRGMHDIYAERYIAQILRQAPVKGSLQCREGL